jgi:hypothetical protein
LLTAFAASGLAFTLLPGTLIGAWNLLTISGQHAAGTVSAAWTQAHGHAQIFGWVGSFILGIGFYSLPKAQRAGWFAVWRGWPAFSLWTAGVLLRWWANMTLWEWRALLPLSAAMELAAFLIFLQAVSGHKAGPGSGGLQKWIAVVMAGTAGFLLLLALNLAAAVAMAANGSGPAFSAGWNSRLLVVSTWGFLAPFVWGFSARWMPVFLGLRPIDERLLLWSAMVNGAGWMAALAGWMSVSAAVILIAAVMATWALRILHPPAQAAKTRGVHPSFPHFVRVAYGWMLAAAVLAVWAAIAGSSGLAGASRHALTVGFVSTMVFAVGQRVLPAFSGMRMLYSPRLMLVSLAALNAGCVLRVTMQPLAYDAGWATAWALLPVSAVLEMAAVTLFALNLALSFLSRPPHEATLAAWSARASA